MDPRLAQALVAPTAEDKAQVAKQEFDRFVIAKPSRQQLKSFMTERATGYFQQNAPKMPRKERRAAAKMLGKRMQKKALNGELE